MGFPGVDSSNSELVKYVVVNSMEYTLTYITCHRALKWKDNSADSKSLMPRTACGLLPKTRQTAEGKANKDKGGNKKMMG